MQPNMYNLTSIQLTGTYSEITLYWRPVAIAGPFQTNPHSYCAPLQQHGDKCCRNYSMRNTHTVVDRWYLLFIWWQWIWFFRPCSISLSMVTNELSNEEQMDSASFHVLPSLGLLGKWSRRHCTHTHTYLKIFYIAKLCTHQTSLVYDMIWFSKH